MDSLHWYLLAVVIATSLGRLAWFLEFATISLRRGDAEGAATANGLKGRLNRVLLDGKLPVEQRGKPEQQKGRYDLYGTQVTGAYTLGGLALAGWSVLAATSLPTNRFALGMLAVTVLTSVGCTIVFRYGGGEVTRMGFESGLAIADLALVIAMLSLVLRVFGDGSLVLCAALVLPGVLLWREGIDLLTQMRLTRHLFDRPDAKRLEPATD